MHNTRTWDRTRRRRKVTMEIVRKEGEEKASRDAKLMPVPLESAFSHTRRYTTRLPFPLSLRSLCQRRHAHRGRLLPFRACCSLTHVLAGYFLPFFALSFALSKAHAKLKRNLGLWRCKRRDSTRIEEGFSSCCREKKPRAPRSKRSKRSIDRV